MTYEVSYTMKDGRRINGQLFDVEHLMYYLKDLEKWECHHIAIKSIETKEE